MASELLFRRWLRLALERDADRDLAFANIKRAAAHYGVEIAEESWRELGKP
jgi:hypothetical protein